MKKFVNFALCFVALGCFCAAMCTDENENENNNNQNNTTYSSEMFVGTWQVENMTVNGQNMTPQNMLFMMYDDGTGLASDNGETENNGFTWSVSGDQLTITPRSGTHYVYTVNSLTENECTFSGNNVPMADIPGNTVVHLVRVR
ncbi:MAG: lipocalin family protein [Bacteroidales bacterium]|jgi:hypothetical protein|nr:lipocalin family protein [Bacteroidales bacterium]